MGMNFVHLVDEGVIAREDVINLADIVNGECGGRKSDDEIIYCSIGGMPLEDLSWGYECYETASKLGIGQNLNLWDEPYLK
jgi:ornithine cyclodeaminase